VTKLMHWAQFPQASASDSAGNFYLCSGNAQVIVGQSLKCYRMKWNGMEWYGGRINFH